MPLVSVIIPMYNAERTIEEAIASVLQQTWQDFEMIVVDDGSTDGSLARVRAIADSRLQVLSFTNAGAAAARNRGIAVAQGEFLAFLDADDWWAADKLEAQIQALQTCPEAGLAYSWSDYIDQDGRFLCLGKRVKVSRREDTYGRLLVSNFLENGSTPLIRRTVLETVGGFDEALRGSQDLDLYLRVARQYAFVTVPKVQVYYRLSAGSMTANLQRQEEQALIFLNRAYAQAPPEFQSLRRASLAHLYRFLMLRGLECPLTPQRSWQVGRCLVLALRYHPALPSQQPRLFFSAMAKIMAGFLPIPWRDWVLAQSQRQRARRTQREHYPSEHR